MTFKVVNATIATAVAAGATFTVGYPTNTDAGFFRGGWQHRMVVNEGYVLNAPADFTLTFGTASITVDLAAAYSLAQGDRVSLTIEALGADGYNGMTDIANMPRVMDGFDIVVFNLGAPDAATDVDCVVEAVSQVAGAITLDGALADADGVVTLDVPRNLVVDSGGADTSPIVFTGTDEYGNVMVESITLNGATAVAGKKAFKTITGAANTATISNGAFVGIGDVLGLPALLVDKGLVLAQLEDGAPATAGTLVAGLTSAVPTATNADVRGTYDPNSAADGAKAFQLVVALPRGTGRGQTQYSA